MDGSMYSGGAGFLLDLFSSNVALRAEWRHRMETASSDNMNDNLFSVGLQIPFGPATAKFVDSDGDGVEDGLDRCPNTPAGRSVDVYGCELDSDNDGVKDSKDQCPGTAAGAKVDAVGCVLVVAVLRRYPTIKIQIEGHTDSDGAADYNESLSARRAMTVHDYLANDGISEDRMSVRGYGETQPIADNTTAAGKAQNRRVVLQITER